jgi:hypothetical protein
MMPATAPDAGPNRSLSEDAMRPRFPIVCLFVLAATTIALPAADDVNECTTIVASGAATRDGGPLLWKNRDTDVLSNKVVFVAEQPHSYLGLVNAEDTAGRMVWAGVNDAGFAIANSVAYNLPSPSGEQQDLEGIIMADALRRCAKVADFEVLITSQQGPDLGSRANFLVIDAQGGAAIFETHNHGFARLDAAEAPEHYLANTNFSRTGKADQGAGYLRFDRETALLRAHASDPLAPEFVLQVLARDVVHALTGGPQRAEWKTLPADKPYWVHTNYTINRSSTSAAVVIQGVKPGDDPRKTTMWVVLGEPVTSIAVPLWVAAGQPPAQLWQGEDAPIITEAFRLKDELRPLKSRERREYADLTRLDNAAGTGWLPALLATERDVMKDTAEFLKQPVSPADMAAFERRAAERVLATLRKQ